MKANENPCKGCQTHQRLTCTFVIKSEQNACPCGECLIKVMCVELCRKRDEALLQLLEKKNETRVSM